MPEVVVGGYGFALQDPVSVGVLFPVPAAVNAVIVGKNKTKKKFPKHQNVVICKLYLNVE